MDKPEIDYPCEWEYKIIGHSEDALRQAAASIAPPGHSIAQGKESKQGKYCSLGLTILVTDEAHRHRLFASLKAHAEIVFVL